jgi:hypothetical protein
MNYKDLKLVQKNVRIPKFLLKKIQSMSKSINVSESTFIRILLEVSIRDYREENYKYLFENFSKQGRLTLERRLDYYSDTMPILND